MTIKEIHTEFIASSGVSTDTRTLQGNEIFFALTGENFNGNRFVHEAVSRGCRLVIADDPALESEPQVCTVEDALDTLQQLANYHRRYWGGKVFAITGSNGKTTTKELISTVLAKKFRVLSTTGNLNNHIGVPLTLLRIREEEIAVIEMGANHIGEIEHLCEIAEPDAGLITNIGKAHLEGFGSLDGVRRAKGELFDYLSSKDNPAIVNLTLSELVGMTSQRKMKTFSYGLDILADIPGELLDSEDGIRGTFSVKGETFQISSVMYGAYNFSNILAAAATGIFFGVKPDLITDAVNMYRPENNRSQIVKGKTNTLILDAYNANPTSMHLALKDFGRKAATRKMVILGDMYELGADSEAEHKQILTLLTELNIDEVLLVGERFYRFSGQPSFPFRFFENLEKCMSLLQVLRPAGFMILLKGSRKNSLEKTTNLLLDC